MGDYILRSNAMEHTAHEERLRGACREFVTGKGAVRTKLDLMVDGRDLSGLFCEVLRESGFTETTVANVKVLAGERVPAFFLDGSVAYFGWVFWEKFTEHRMRKLWGSVVRNAKGDWSIQIPEGKRLMIYADSSSKIEMDMEKPE